MQRNEIFVCPEDNLLYILCAARIDYRRSNKFFIVCNIHSVMCIWSWQGPRLSKTRLSLHKRSHLRSMYLYLIFINIQLVYNPRVPGGSYQPSSSGLLLTSTFSLPNSRDSSSIARKNCSFSIPCGITGKRCLGRCGLVAMSWMRPFARCALCKSRAGTPLCFCSRVGVRVSSFGDMVQFD